MIEFCDVHKSFGQTKILQGLSLQIARGEIFFLIGTSGVGKTVAIKHLVGLLRVDAGSIHFDGERIDDLSEAAFYPVRKRIGMVFQHATLFDSMDLVENVALPLKKHRNMKTREAKRIATELLERVHLHDFVHHKPRALSDGMKKRAAIARTLAMEPQVMLFDEPTTGLDPVSARRIDALIRELADDMGVTSIVVSHDLKSTFSIADRIALLYKGVAYRVNTPDAFASDSDAIVRQFVTGNSHGPMETPGF